MGTHPLTARVGIGYDLHRLVPDRPLLLGGIRIPCDRGLLGHSDADVVLHALCDALLGAIAQPDIGELFPDSDPRWKNADSRLFVTEALRRVTAAGYTPANVDLVIIAEQPRLGPYKDQIQSGVADLLAIPRGNVAIKAKTNEGVDAIGRGEAIACWAAILLTPRVASEA